MRETAEPGPPGLARWILTQLVIYRNDHAIVGDVEEVYRQIYLAEGRLAAWRWYWAETIMALFRYTILKTRWSLILGYTYLLAAIRFYKRNRATTLINLFGLTIGLAACLIILEYVGYEQSYDTFHV